MSGFPSAARFIAAALLALASCLANAQPSFGTIKSEVVSTGEMIRAAGVKPE